MGNSSYAMSLEFYVKSFVKYKSVATSRENGTYDKMLMRFVMDFTYKTSPKKTWDVSRAVLLEDMKSLVEIFETYNYVNMRGGIYLFDVQDGSPMFIFADNEIEAWDSLFDFPDFASPYLSPSLSSGIAKVTQLTPNDFTIDGQTFKLNYRLIDHVVNIADRLAVSKI